MDILKKRWLILIASCIVNLCIGSLYSWSVFSVPMAAHLSSISGKEITNLAIVFTLANAVGPITMISGGSVNDRLGPKWVLLLGGVLFGGGMIGAGFSTSVAGLMLTYGLGVGLGIGLVYGTTISNTVKFFPDKRGLAGGLTTAFYGCGSIIIPRIANLLIQNYHVTTAFRLIGTVALIVVCSSAFVIIPCPKDFKLGDKSIDEPRVKAGSKEIAYREMLKSPKFYIMISILMCGAFAGLMIISQISPIAQQMIGFSASQAATAVSILALFNTLGRVLAGAISDRIGVLNTLTITSIGSVLSSIMLFFCNVGSAAPFYIGLAVTGICFGAIMGTFPGFTAAQFGSKNNSVNYGIMWIGFALAGSLGPVIMGNIHSFTGEYQAAFIVSMVLAGIGLALIQLFRFLSRKPTA